MGELERLVDSYVKRNGANNFNATPVKRSVFQLRIERDGVIKYCHSYSNDISPNTVYFTDADDERMSCPYGFRSFKQAEWLYWNWMKASGQQGWHFEVQEVFL